MEPRNEKATTKLTETEKNIVRQRANAIGIGVSTFIRQVVLSHIDENKDFSFMKTDRISADGHFYLISVFPDLQPGRIKFGHTQNVDLRLKQHRVYVPNAELVASFPCKQYCEYPAIQAITNFIECKPIGREVFDFPSVEEVVKRAKIFFSFLEGK